MNEPVSLRLASAARDPAWDRPGYGSTAATAEHALLRIALWLADVAMEAALAATTPVGSSAPEAASSRCAEGHAEPPVVEPVL